MSDIRDCFRSIFKIFMAFILNAPYALCGCAAEKSLLALTDDTVIKSLQSELNGTLDALEQELQEFVNIKISKIVKGEAQRFEEKEIEPFKLRYYEMLLAYLNKLCPYITFQDFYQQLDKNGKEIKSFSISASPEFRAGYCRGLKTNCLHVCLELRMQMAVQKGPKGSKAYQEFIENNVVNLYKIHLMPDDHYILHAVALFLRSLMTNKLLQDTIADFKIIGVFDRYQEITAMIGHRAEFAPKIVIYIKDGKESAQRALDELYGIFFAYPEFERKGSPRVIPSYNEKFTNLIYVAQGNRNEKNGQTEKYFDTEGGMIYYDAMISGILQDYRLSSPRGIMIINPNAVAPIAVRTDHVDQEGRILKTAGTLDGNGKILFHSERFAKLKTISLAGEPISKVVIQNMFALPIEVYIPSGRKHVLSPYRQLRVTWYSKANNETIIQLPVDRQTRF